MFGRRSRFKHVFGKANKKEECYEGIRISTSSVESKFCDINPKYLAIITESGGGSAFLVWPIEKYGRIDHTVPLVDGHRGAILDIKWCPHDVDVIASASEDCTVKVWHIPEGGLEPETNLSEPEYDLLAHERRVSLVLWHPTASNVLLSAGADNHVYIWDVKKQTPLVEMEFPEPILSASFNFDGSRLVTTCKDCITRLLNPHDGTTISQGVCHEGKKPQEAVLVRNNLVFTTGFTPLSDRQYALWDPQDFTKPKIISELDKTNGVLYPFYDADVDLIFLAAKGDSSVRYFEISDEPPFVHFLGMYTSSSPQRGMGFMPKRGLNVNAHEIARFFKLHTSNLCEVIPFTVPRKSELFQDDLYPDTPGDQPALTADQWSSGQDAPPILISLKDGYTPKSRAVARAATSVKDRPKPSRTTTDNGTSGHHHTGDAKVAKADSSLADIVKQLKDDMDKIKMVIKGHERRVKHLEGQLEAMKE